MTTRNAPTERFSRRSPTEPALLPPQPPLATGLARTELSGWISAVSVAALLQGVGCTPEQQAPRMTAVPEARDVEVRFPVDLRVDLPADHPIGPAAEGSPPDSFAPTRPPLSELAHLLAEDREKMPNRLRELERKRAEANAIQADRPPEPAPSAVSAAPASQPSRVTAPPPSAVAALAGGAPLPPPESAPATTPAPVALPTPEPKGPPVETPITKALATPEMSSTAQALADAITTAIQRNAAAEPGRRSIGQAVNAALAAIGDPARNFDPASYPGLDEDERAFVVRLHEASAAVGRDLTAGKPIGEAVARLADAIKAVEPVKPLLVKRSEFATKVDGFGQLSPIANRRFLPGRQNQVILYTELDGFNSERNDKNEWVTNLATKVQILAKHDGTEVWSRNWQAVTDVSSVRRDDFFVCEKVVLSEFLTIGTYLLKVSVRDEKTQAIAEKSVEFSMVADPALAGR